MNSVIRVWWWASVPYVLVFSTLILWFRPYPGLLVHVYYHFLIAFELALYPCIGWLVVILVRAAVTRRLAPASLAMLLASMVASLIGVYLEFFWTGNMG